MGRLLAKLLAVWILFAGAAPAFQDRFDEQTRERLGAGERVRMLIFFDTPTAAEGAAEGINSISENDARAAIITATRDALISQVFNRTTFELSELPPGSDEPRIIRVFRHTPALAIMLNQNELTGLENQPGVQIFPDGVERPFLHRSASLVGAGVMHDLGFTGSGVGLAILDTGVDHQHPAFAGRIVASACFSSTVPELGATSYCPGGAQQVIGALAGDNCENEADAPGQGAADGSCFHGTHVAGIAAGAAFTDPATPGRELQGVAPQADVIAVQVFSRFTGNDCDGATSCSMSFVSDQLAALEWLYDTRVAYNLGVINMSLGGSRHFSPCVNELRASIINSLQQAGVATVAASGNHGWHDSISAPACVPAAISVGSTSLSDSHSSFSNSAQMLDLLAPGQSIYSARHSPNNAGAALSRDATGTSMAAPHVAGAIALLREAHPDATVEQILNALRTTGSPVVTGSNNLVRSRIRVDLAHQALAGGEAPREMSVEPAVSFITTGNPDDPDSFGSLIYTVRNVGEASFIWQITTHEEFISLALIDSAGQESTTSVSGELAPGEATEVLISVNAAILAPNAIYQGQIRFTNDAGEEEIRFAQVSTYSAPANNLFRNAHPITGVSHHFSFNNRGATKEPGEPNHAGYPGGSSLWWRWTAPVTGQFRFSTGIEGPFSFNKTLAIYTGDALDDLIGVISNAICNPPNDANSCLVLEAVAGTTYHIAVDSRGGAQGVASLRLEYIGYPHNELIADAEVIDLAQTTRGLSIVGTNINARSLAGDPFINGGTMYNSVWYRLDAHDDVVVSLDTSGSDFTAQLALFTGEPSEFVLHSVSTVSPGTVHFGRVPHLLRFEASAGESYHLAVYTSHGSSGLYRLNLRINDTAGHRLRAAVLPRYRTSRDGSTVTAFATIINPISGNTDGHDCRLAAPHAFSGDFSFQTTDPHTNAVTGARDAPVDIPAGGSQSFVFAVRHGWVGPSQFSPIFECENIESAPVNAVNLFDVTVAAGAAPDIIAVAATLGDMPGVVSVPLDGVTAFSVAAINIGDPEERVVVWALPSDEYMELDMTICETNPQTGACLAPHAPYIDSSFSVGQVRTYTVRVRSLGEEVSFEPRHHRIEVLFAAEIETFTTVVMDEIVGGTNVAVRTTD
ncbi:MAG: S8 family serine peptidase [Maricaulaceae bacterium]|nr:S8 family serine peptidase [Maricaulaceae bacterium]